MKISTYIPFLLPVLLCTSTSFAMLLPESEKPAPSKKEVPSLQNLSAEALLSKNVIEALWQSIESLPQEYQTSLIEHVMFLFKESTKKSSYILWNELYKGGSLNEEHQKLWHKYTPIVANSFKLDEAHDSITKVILAAQDKYVFLTPILKVLNNKKALFILNKYIESDHLPLLTKALELGINPNPIAVVKNVPGQHPLLCAFNHNNEAAFDCLRAAGSQPHIDLFNDSDRTQRYAIRSYNLPHKQYDFFSKLIILCKHNSVYECDEFDLYRLTIIPNYLSLQSSISDRKEARCFSYLNIWVHNSVDPKLFLLEQPKKD